MPRFISQPDGLPPANGYSHVNLAAPPASTLVQVSALVNPAFRVEVDAVAVISA